MHCSQAHQTREHQSGHQSSYWLWTSVLNFSDLTRTGVTHSPPHPTTTVNQDEHTLTKKLRSILSITLFKLKLETSTFHFLKGQTKFLTSRSVPLNVYAKSTKKCKQVCEVKRTRRDDTLK